MGLFNRDTPLERTERIAREHGVQRKDPVYPESKRNPDGSVKEGAYPNEARNFVQHPETGEVKLTKRGAKLLRDAGATEKQIADAGGEHDSLWE